MKRGIALVCLASFWFATAAQGSVCYRDDGDCRTFFSYNVELNQTYVNGYCKLGHEQFVLFFDHGALHGDFTYMCA